LADHLKNHKKQLIEEKSDLTTGQVANLTSGQVEAYRKLSQKQHKILSFCKQPQSMKAIQEHLQITSRSYFREKMLKPLIDTGLLTMTNPNPKASNQQYVITEAGIVLKVAMAKDE
jgi:ATP-dependent DNA helicase RecG